MGFQSSQLFSSAQWIYWPIRMLLDYATHCRRSQATYYPPVFVARLIFDGRPRDIAWRNAVLLDVGKEAQGWANIHLSHMRAAFHTFEQTQGIIITKVLLYLQMIAGARLLLQ